MAKKVLIVDDEQDIRASVKHLVESIGFEAKAVGGAKQALALLRKEKFDLVLMDIFMPQMSGRDAVQKMRTDPKLKKQKVAFLTVAQLSEAGREKINKLKPVEYFQKPIELDGFSKRLKKLLK